VPGTEEDFTPSVKLQEVAATRTLAGLLQPFRGPHGVPGGLLSDAWEFKRSAGAAAAATKAVGAAVKKAAAAAAAAEPAPAPAAAPLSSSSSSSAAAAAAAAQPAAAAPAGLPPPALAAAIAALHAVKHHQQHSNYRAAVRALLEQKHKNSVSENTRAKKLGVASGARPVQTISVRLKPFIPSEYASITPRDMEHLLGAGLHSHGLALARFSPGAATIAVGARGAFCRY
jgi:hypothetical protein